jgi:hypothetical protein
MRAVATTPHSLMTERTTASAVIDRLTRQHRFPLTASDTRRLLEIYRRFARQGPALRWSRDRLAWLPTYAQLMTTRDGSGEVASYLASETRFAVVKRLQAANLLVPVVGDFGGTKTLRAIGDELRARHTTVTAFYTSNVDPYLRGESRTRYIDNVRRLPIDPRTVFIRTLFHLVAPGPPKPSYATTTVIAPIAGDLEAWTSP